MSNSLQNFNGKETSRMEITHMKTLHGAMALCLSGVLVLAGCMGGKWGGKFSMPPAMVEVAEATIQPVEDRFEAVGSLEADNAITVVSEIAGTVAKIAFDEGRYVERGSLIAQLNDDELKAEYDRATATRDQTQASFNRVKTIVEQHAGAQQDLDDAAAALKVAEANAAYAAARLQKTRITAPFSGIIGARQVSPGAYVRPGDPIADLARVQELRVKFSAPERYLSQLKRGSKVTVSTLAYPDYELKGTIEAIEPQVDPNTRSVSIVARVPNSEGKLRPGMSANVAAVLSVRDNALTVPSEAVIVDQNQTVVYAIKPDSTVARTVVRLGSRMREAVEIVSGLKEGQRVVRAGQQKIFEGAKVMPISSADSLAAEANGKKDTAKVAP
jgi:membrane fusion protein (multidrug efflux system)